MEALQHPLLKVPSERMSQRFRRFHKRLTKEITGLNAQVRGYRREQSTAETAAGAQTLERLEMLTQRIQDAKQCVDEYAKTQQADAEICVRRAQFLVQLQRMQGQEQKRPQEIKSEDASETKQEEDREEVGDVEMADGVAQEQLIADYLLSQGCMATSKLVQQQHGIEYLVDQTLHEDRLAILKDLERREVASAIQWCTENGSRLRRLQSTLEFQLRLQEFIELVRADKKLEAIQYAQGHLAPMSMQQEDETMKKTLMDAIQEAMATLAFESPATCGVESYSRLFSEDRWGSLKDLFHKTFCSAYGMHDPPSLFIALYAGLSTLNTRTCQRKRKARALRDIYLHEEEEDQTSEQASSQKHKKARVATSSERQTGSAHTDDDKQITRTHHHPSTVGEETSLCPACSSACSSLCDGLPVAPHPHSHLLCRVTHKTMDEHNPPMALPNGHVYSRQAIEQMTKGQGKQAVVTCPITRDSFALADLKPVYIL